MGKAVSQDNKAIAKTLLNAFGTKPSVQAYWDDAHRFSVDILSCENPVDNLVTDYGTIGTSDYPLYQDGKEFNVRVELVGTANKSFDYMPNLLTTAALTIIKDKWFCHPGAVLRDVVAIYNKTSALKHLYFAAPGLWQDRLETLELHTKTVAWLHAIPITELERQYILEQSDEALEDLFEEKQIDVADLNRNSVV